MWRYVAKRLLFMVPTLVGISFVTFLLLEIAPGDAVLRELAEVPGAPAADARTRAEHVDRLMKKHGLVDPVTGVKLSLGVRYARWLKNAVAFDFSGEATDRVRFRDRILTALPKTLLLNALALLLAFAIAIPLGVRMGMRAGGLSDRAVNGAVFVVYGLPDFLVATLLLLVFCGGFFTPLLPSGGLQSPNAGELGGFARAFDLAKHLLLPVTTLAFGYGVIVFRFLRESVARANNSDFVLALRGYGASEQVVRGRVLRNGLSPVVTVLGTMLPTLVGGTVVIETIFSVRGLGWLTTTAVQDRDMSMVMALTMLVSTITLISLLLSDILQRVVDPRVELR